MTEINLLKYFKSDDIYVRLDDSSKIINLINLDTLPRFVRHSLKRNKSIKLSYLQETLDNNFIELNNQITSVKIGRFGKFLNLPLTFETNLDWFYISELIRTDGHISKNFDRIKVTNNDKTLLIKFENFCKSLGIKYVDKGSDRYHVYNSTLAKILNRIFEIQNGNKSLRTYLPRWIKNLDDRSVSYALRGAFDGDGTVQNDSSGTRRVRFNTGSKRYADDIQECLIKFGIRSSVFKDPRPNKNVWYVEIPDKVSLTKFQQEIGFSQLKRLKKLNGLLDSYVNYPIEEFEAILQDLLQINNRMTITQIAKTMGRSPSTVSSQIIKLENSGVIKTERIGNKKFVKLLSNDRSLGY